MENENIIKQGLLFASAEQIEYDNLELSVARRSPRFKELSEEKRKFVVYYLTRGAGDTMEKIASRCGIGKSKAYELAKDPEVCDAMAGAAQAISDTSDIKGSLAIDMTAEKIYEAVRNGYLQPKDWTPVMLKICEASKSRLGLNPQYLNSVKVQLNNADGSSVSATMLSGGFESVLDRLAAASESTPLSSFEAERAENVRPVIEASVVAVEDSTPCPALDDSPSCSS